MVVSIIGRVLGEARKGRHHRPTTTPDAVLLKFIMTNRGGVGKVTSHATTNHRTMRQGKRGVEAVVLVVLGVALQE